MLGLAKCAGELTQLGIQGRVPRSFQSRGYQVLPSQRATTAALHSMAEL
jgi:hypothetical protein